MNRRKAVGPLIGVAAGTVITALLLVGVEVAMRIAGVKPRGSLVFESARCYFGWGAYAQEGNANSSGHLWHEIRTDARGFRVANEAFSITVPARCRVLCTGDSFTEGLYVRGTEAYPAVLESSLRSRGYSVSVLNAGMRGHTISEERVEAIARWSDLHPGVVVVQHTGNDLGDLLRLMRAGCDVGGGPPFHLRGDLPAFLESSSTVGWLRRRGHRLSFGSPAALRQLDRITATTDECDTAAAEYLREATNIADVTVRDGRRVIFGFVEPFVCPTPRERDWDREAFTRRFDDQIAAHGGRVLRMEGLLDRDGATLRPEDSHPSAAGHRLIADRIAEDLIASGALARCAVP